MPNYCQKPSSCTGCPWEKEGLGYAAGAGPTNAKLVVVAESLGGNEAQQGIPLIGWTGQQFNGFLKNHGVQRSEIYADNVVRCMPPPGFKKGGNKGKAKILKEVINHCTTAHVGPALEFIKPNTIIALGEWSLRFLTGKKGISKHRSSILESRYGKVIPTLHPAYLIKGPSAVVMGPFIDFDIGRAVRESAFPEIHRPVENFNVTPTYEECIDFLLMVEEAGECSVDIETSGGNWWNTAILCVGFYCKDRAISIPFLGQNGSEIWNVHELSTIISTISNTLRNPLIRKTFQNENYDIQVLESYGFRVARNTRDTMIQNHVIYSEKGIPHDLAFINSIYTDIPFYKDDVKGEDNFALLDPLVMRWYNCRDTLSTNIAGDAMDEEIDEHGVRDTYEQDMRLLPVIRNIQKRGVMIDQDKLVKYREQLDDEIGQAIVTVEQALGSDFISYKKNGRPTITNNRLRTFLFSELQLEPISYTQQTREPQVDLDTLLALTEQVDPALEKLLRVLIIWRKLDKLRETYFDEFILDSKGRLHTSYTIHVTPTGRLSSRGPNLQNIPPGMAKELFIPSVGYVFISRDYEQIEIRIFAELCGDDILLEAFARGDDIHTINACELFNLGTVTKDQRDFEKTWLYGAILYGGTASTVRRQALSKLLRRGNTNAYIPSIKEIERMQQSYYSRHPKIVEFQQRISWEVRKHRRLTTPLGRTRIFLGREADIIRAGYNFPNQGTAADIINRACIALDEALPEPSGMVLQCHDEIVFETAESQVEEVVETSGRLMEAPVDIYGKLVKFPTACKKGYSWENLEKVS